MKTTEAEIFVMTYLGHSGFWKVNKALFAELECFDTTILLTELSDRFRYLKQEKRLLDNEWFFYTREALEGTLKFSSAKQRACLVKLKAKGFVEMKKGNEMPKRTYYKIRFDKLQIAIMKIEKKKYNGSN